MRGVRVDRAHRGARGARPRRGCASRQSRDALVGQAADLAGEGAVAGGDVVGGAARDQPDVDAWCRAGRSRSAASSRAASSIVRGHPVDHAGRRPSPPRRRCGSGSNAPRGRGRWARKPQLPLWPVTTRISEGSPTITASGRGRRASIASIIGGAPMQPISSSRLSARMIGRARPAASISGTSGERAGEEALHVAGAAAVQPAVALGEREGVGGPVLAGDRDDVGVAGEHDAALGRRRRPARRARPCRRWRRGRGSVATPRPAR